ncbi:MAG: Gfo/Idh/MocA family oxidoreductase [Chloroflexi bacterium]|nr:Gfo/Idh/MocA family oxidoreductase [Chloroflexota bacterium]MCY3936888.1 Gfo/Idh/MocA family oxidoreductase [Chloroflexota bacterium]
MASKLRAAVIGCGSMGVHHTRGYLDTGRFEIAAISDMNPDVLDEMDARFGADENYCPDRFTDPNRMLDSQTFDVVSVCTWHREHAVWTIAAATRKPGIIISEKPMAEDLGRAEEMRTVCERNGVKLAIAHQRRFLPSYVLARQMIADGVIGDVELMYSSAGWGLPNWSSHHADMYRFLLQDECAWVMGAVTRTTDRMERGTRIEDGAMAVFQFKRGTRCVLLSDVTGEIYQGASIYGSEGIIDLLPERVRVSGPDTGGQWITHAPNGRFYNVDSDNFEYVEGAAAQANELANWAEGKIDVYRGEALNGYKALEMIMAVYESARLHEHVFLPLKTKVNPLDVMVEQGHLPVVYPGTYDIRGFKLHGENTLYDRAGG